MHRGKILQKAVQQTGLSIERIANKAGYKRGTYYLHIKQPDLSPSILFKYGKALGYDFSEDIPDLVQFVAEPGIPYAAEALTIQEAIRQRDEWKDKYYEVLEKYMRLLDRKA